MLWKKAVLLGLTGFVIGALIGVGFVLAGAGRIGRADLLHFLIGGFYGAIAMGSSVVYEIEKWSIARATATHFLTVFFLYFLLVISMGWFSLKEPIFWIVVAFMAVGYVLIWLFQYLAYRRMIRKMNEDLEKFKNRK